jgi:hypothetical protein
LFWIFGFGGFGSAKRSSIFEVWFLSCMNDKRSSWFVVSISKLWWMILKSSSSWGSYASPLVWTLWIYWECVFTKKIFFIFVFELGGVSLEAFSWGSFLCIVLNFLRFWSWDEWNSGFEYCHFILFLFEDFFFFWGGVLELGWVKSRQLNIERSDPHFFPEESNFVHVYQKRAT